MNGNWKLRLAGLVTVFVLGGASLVAAHGGDPNLIHACVKNANGGIRIVAPMDTCRENETPLDWNAGGASQAGGGGLFTVTGWTGSPEIPPLCAAPWDPGFIVCGTVATRLPIPRAGTLVALAVQAHVAQAGRVTVRVNGVDTALTVELPGDLNVATGQAEVPVQAGDWIEVAGTTPISPAFRYNATVEYRSP